MLSNFHVSPTAFDCAGIGFLGDDKVLFDFITQLTQLVEKNVIFGDFNIPNVSWPLDFSQSFDVSSQLLVDLLINSHLHQLVLQPTRYRSNQIPSLLDLIVSSDDSVE